MKFVNFFLKTKFRQILAGTILAILTFAIPISVIVWASDIDVPANFNNVYMSDVKTLQITSGSSYASIKINGDVNIDTIIVKTPNYSTTPTTVLTLANSALSTYYSSTALVDNTTNVITVSKPIKGVVSATLTLSTAANTGGQTGTLQFYFTKNPSR